MLLYDVLESVQVGTRRDLEVRSGMDMYQLGKRRGEWERCTIRADARGCCPGLGRGDQDE